MSKVKISFTYVTGGESKTFEKAFSDLEEWGTHDLSDREKEAYLNLAAVEMEKQGIDATQIDGDVKIVESTDNFSRVVFGAAVVLSPLAAILSKPNPTWEYTAPRDKLNGNARFFSPGGAKSVAGVQTTNVIEKAETAAKLVAAAMVDAAGKVEMVEPVENVETAATVETVKSVETVETDEVPQSETYKAPPPPDLPPPPPPAWNLGDGEMPGTVTTANETPTDESGT
jgi:hypothetical protein